MVSTNVQILKVSGPIEADRQPLRCRQAADAVKQVSWLIEKTKQIPQISP